jgi:RNA polymerase sigma-70 factor (ECF subfamily)
MTMARSRALDRVRAQSRRVPREQLLGGDMALETTGSPAPSKASVTPEQLAPPADQPVEQAEARRIVRLALAELPGEQRQVLELAYFEGLSQTEIAERTREPLGTIKTRMRLALRKLRDRLRVLREEAR